MYEFERKVIEIVIILQRTLIPQQFYALSLYKLYIALKASLILLQFPNKLSLLNLYLPLEFLQHQLHFQLHLYS